MSVDTSGMDRIRAGLPDAIERGIVSGADMIADVARQLVPVLSGDLQGTIRVEMGRQQLARRVVAGGQNGVDYAAAVEYGTSNPNYPAQPYMTPAKNAIDVAREIALEVGKLIEGSRV